VGPKASSHLLGSSFCRSSWSILDNVVSTLSRSVLVRGFSTAEVLVGSTASFLYMLEYFSQLRLVTICVPIDSSVLEVYLWKVALT
jgi:hypothetical protein